MHVRVNELCEQAGQCAIQVSIRYLPYCVRPQTLRSTKAEQPAQSDSLSPGATPCGGPSELRLPSRLCPAGIAQSVNTNSDAHNAHTLSAYLESIKPRCSDKRSLSVDVSRLQARSGIANKKCNTAQRAGLGCLVQRRVVVHARRRQTLAQ